MRKHRNLKHWLKCDSTRLWLKCDSTRLWLKCDSTRLWLKCDSTRLWLKCDSTRLWLKCDSTRLWLKCDSTRLWLTKLRLRGNTMTYRTPFQVFRDLDVKGTPVTCIPDWETTCNVNWFPGTRDV